MATAKEKEDISQLKTDVSVIQTDMQYVKRDLAKVVDFVDNNKGGITLATLLNSRIISVVLGGIVIAGLWFASKVGAGQ